MNPDNATYLLIHGGNMSADTWNRLSNSVAFAPGTKIGEKIWNPVVAALQTRGFNVYAPALKDENTCNLTGHIEQILRLITQHNLNNIILAGHSYGGMVITGVATQIPEKIRHLIYIDGALPDPGQSLYDLLHIDLSSFSGPKPMIPDPAPAYVERLEYNPVVLREIAKTYILCTQSEFIGVTLPAKEKILADPQNWTYTELPASHVPMAEMPDRLNQLLLDAAKESGK